MLNNKRQYMNQFQYLFKIKKQILQFKHQNNKLIYNKFNQKVMNYNTSKIKKIIHKTIFILVAMIKV